MIVDDEGVLGRLGVEYAAEDWTWGGQQVLGRWRQETVVEVDF